MAGSIDWVNLVFSSGFRVLDFAVVLDVLVRGFLFLMTVSRLVVGFTKPEIQNLQQ